MTKKRTIIGITGGSGSGKTTLVKQLIELYDRPVTELSQDRYYRDLSHLALEERSTTNFDCPGALEGDLFLQHIDALSRGKSIRAPRYDFENHTRIGEEIVHPSAIIVIEGTLILAVENMRECLDLAVYLDAPADIRLIRKIQRDISQRGRTLEASIAQYLDTVRPMHERYTAPYKDKADFVFDGTQSISVVVKTLISAINSLIG